MDKLDKLIVQIYEIIPAYYDEKEVTKIKKLILKYIEEEKNMKFKLFKSSDYYFEKNININSNNELIEFCKNEGGRIVIDTNENFIEIYDDYRE